MESSFRVVLFNGQKAQKWKVGKHNPYASFRAVLLNFLLSSFPLPNSPSLYISDVGEDEPQNKASRYTSSTLLRHHFPAFGKQDCFLLSCLPKVTLLSAFLLSFFSLKILNSPSSSTLDVGADKPLNEAS